MSRRTRSDKNPDIGDIECAEPGCTESIRDHSWGKIKATGWFFQQDGTAWCPKHVPDWVASWRANRGKKWKGE